MIIDTHTHYDHSRFKEDRAQLLEGLTASGISHVINVGSSPESSRASVKLADAYPNIYATIGTHPHYAKDLTEQKLEAMLKLAAHPKVVAIGEIGLDYHHNYSPPDAQREWFRRQLECARGFEKPFVIHCREAFSDTIQMLRECTITHGVVHSFSGTAEEAAAYLELGLYIGINGVVTFKGADELCRAVKTLPHDRFVLETDCPYLAPHPNRGKRNDSTQLVHVARRVGELLGKSAEWVAETTSANARALFGI